MKTYTFILEDKDGNELDREEWECFDIKDARKLAKKKLANSLMNDLKKIKVHRS